MRKITVNGNLIDWEERMTLDVILKKLNYTYKMLIVKVNGELVQKNQYDSYIVPEGADLKIIHLISGG